MFKRSLPPPPPIEALLVPTTPDRIGVAGRFALGFDERRLSRSRQLWNEARGGDETTVVVVSEGWAHLARCPHVYDKVAHAVNGTALELTSPELACLEHCRCLESSSDPGVIHRAEMVLRLYECEQAEHLPLLRCWSEVQRHRMWCETNSDSWGLSTTDQILRQRILGMAYENDARLAGSRKEASVAREIDAFLRLPLGSAAGVRDAIIAVDPRKAGVLGVALCAHFGANWPVKADIETILAVPRVVGDTAVDGQGIQGVWRCQQATDVAHLAQELTMNHKPAEAVRRAIAQVLDYEPEPWHSRRVPLRH